jgi:tRNA U34 2-thiouridine synthase MnmA/TrmU
MNRNIVLGLSGGVDSAVSALLLRDAGWEVSCLYLDIGLGGEKDAAAVAEHLGLPFYKVDIRAALEQCVCAPFAEEYLGRANPLPADRCYPEVKFPLLPWRTKSAPALSPRTLRQIGQLPFKAGPPGKRPILHAGPAHPGDAAPDRVPPGRV